MYPLPEDGSEEPPLMFAHIPSPKPVPVIVRLYVVRVRLLLHSKCKIG